MRKDLYCITFWLQGLFKWVNGTTVAFQNWKNTYYFNNLSQSDKFNLIGYRASDYSIVDPQQITTMSRTIYPEYLGIKCTAILLTNLAHTEWLTINCHEAMLFNFLCYFEHNKTHSISQNILSTVIHNVSCILINCSCYKINWYYSTYDKLIPMYKIKDDADLAKFQFLFEAVNVNFPPFLTSDLNHTMTYTRYGSLFHYQKHINSEVIKEGLIITEEEPIKFFLGGNLFNCSYKVLISIKFVCDGVIDCPQNSPEDEKGCEFSDSNVTSNFHSLINQHHPCRKHNGCLSMKNCQIFLEIPWKEKKWDTSEQYTGKSLFILKYNINNQNNTFLCLSNQVVIRLLLVNDLVSDCGPENEDEPHLLLNALGQNCSCSNRYQIPCRKGHSKCYNISAICTYRLNEIQHLTPCRTGEHLENCRQFECNMMFKCSNYYCVPWGYVCDGKWDCPNGDEENPSCSIMHHCNGAYKCKSSQICIHIGDVCNNVEDCPLKDDEYFCLLSNILCPSGCLCLAFTIKCYNVSIHLKRLKFVLPFFKVHIEQCNPVHTIVMLSYFTVLHFVMINNDNLKEVCDIKQEVLYCVMIDGSLKNINIIKRNCFGNAIYLKSIKLSNNYIFKIHGQAFKNLKSLSVLNISGNFLLSLPSSVLYHVPNLRVLSLKNNSMRFYQKVKALELALVETTDQHLCCITHPDIVCD